MAVLLSPVGLPLMTVGSLMMTGGALALATYLGCLAVLRRGGDHAFLTLLLLVAAVRAILPVALLVLPLPDDLPLLGRWAVLLERLDILSLLLIAGLYLLFLRALYPDDVPRPLAVGLAAGCGLLGLLGLALDRVWLPGLHEWAFVAVMGVLVVVGALVVLLLRRCREGAGWIAISVLLLVTAVLYDLLVASRAGTGAVSIMPAGCVLFAVGHVFLMGMRLNRVFLASETVSRHVAALNRTLERQITEVSRTVSASRDQLQAILACIPEGVMTVSPDGTIDSFGPGAERIFGWSSREVVGQTALNLVSGPWGDRLMRSLRRFADEGVLTYAGQGDIEMEGRRRDGSLFPMLCNLTCMDVSGQPLFVVAVRDMSGERTLRREVADATALVGQQAADLDLIEDRSAIGHYVVTSEGERQCVRWSRGFERLWGYEDGRVPTSLAGFFSSVHSDDQGRVFTLVEKRDWTSASCVLRVHTLDAEERLIELSILRHRDDSGSICREIGVARLVAATSLDPIWPAVAPGCMPETGENAMSVVPPLDPLPGSMIRTPTGGSARSPMAGGVAGPDAAAAPSGPLDILLVEDVEVNRRVAVAFLEREGHRIAIASNGIEAVEMAAAADYDLILMDIRLPDLDGVEATRRIRALPDSRRAAVPVLALTANVFGDDVRRYEDVGMSGVVAKPIRMAQFRIALANALRQQAERQHPAATGPEGWSLDLPLDIGFIADRQTALGQDNFKVILDLGRRSVTFAVEELAEATAQETPDLSVVAKAAHRLAGAASNFGFSALYALGRQVEELIEQGQGAAALALCVRLPGLYRDTEAGLDRWLETGVAATGGVVPLKVRSA